ncbi:MAG: acyltransferase [Candidatus Binatia bacterium]
MQVPLFDDRHPYARPLKGLAEADLAAKQRVLLLALNFIPLLHIIIVILLALSPFVSWAGRLLLSAAALYLLPPFLARLVRAGWKIPEGRIAVGSKAFFAWWALLQLQMLFCRLPALEEFLRLLPGAYSAWLRFWGARIGRLTFWSPGTVILDRPYLCVGNHVILGAGVRVNPHVIAKNSSDKLELILGTVKIGDRARVGGYALLTAGSEIASDEDTDAFLVLPPFSSFKGGKRVRTKEQP